MRIRRLKLSGFKSFVEPVEMRIEPGLTGIVGPNGCGKSNLLEAIRWVMGEGSPKSLRGGGMDDVIFAGTQRRPARDFAEVSMLVEREGDDGREDVVTRRIERGTGSAYRLNGRDVRQKDVALLFADAATGAHSPALVSQGRIGAVIAARPAERRQLLEEAAGIAGLHARRKDAEQRLRATEANLTRADELLVEQEARAAALRRQARVAERYREVSARVRLAEGRVKFARWRQADELAHSAELEAASAEAAVAVLKDRLATAREAAAAADAIVTQRRAESHAARDSAREATHRQANDRSRLDVVRQRLADVRASLDGIDAERARETALREEAEAAAAALKQEASDIAARLAAAEGDGIRLTTALTEGEAKARIGEARLAEALARQAGLAAERRFAEATLAATQAQVARFDDEERRLAAALAAEGLGSAETLAAEAARQSRRGAEAAVKAAEAAIVDAETARTVAAVARDQAEPALAEARARIAAVTGEAKALRAATAEEGATATIARASPGFERALAAALGDDLDAPVGAAGARRWSGSEIATDDPPLAQGLITLADHVAAPPELARRLRQIAVVDSDEGQLLAVGQRLVTRDGALRRWDGFVAISAGATTAQRLLRHNRLESLAGEEAAAQAAEGEALAAAEAASAKLTFEQSALAEARRELGNREQALREAVRAEDAATAALERRATKGAALKLRRAELGPVRAAAVAALSDADRTLAAIDDPAALDSAIAALRSEAAILGAAVSERRYEATSHPRSVAADRERAAAVERDGTAWHVRAAAAGARVAAIGNRADRLGEEQATLAGQPEDLDRQIVEGEALAVAAERAAEQAVAAEANAVEAQSAGAAATSDLAEAASAAREARAGAIARMESQVARRAESARQTVDLFEVAPDALPRKIGFDPASLRDPDAEARALDQASAERERLGPVNLVAQAELAELDSANAAAAVERDELREAVNRLRGSIGHLNREGRVRLLEAFAAVDRHFRSLFTSLFDGGQAELRLVDSDDPLEAGLEILAQPPGKRLTALTLLSGGEQALTAVALIFALFLTNPAPICVLDEVDAPLDDANVERFCDLLARMTALTDTRYLIVTHNAVTMSRMDRLYGVTMIEQGVSRLVSVNLQSDKIQMREG